MEGELEQNWLISQTGLIIITNSYLKTSILNCINTLCIKFSS